MWHNRATEPNISEVLILILKSVLVHINSFHIVSIQIYDESRIVRLPTHFFSYSWWSIGTSAMLSGASSVICGSATVGGGGGQSEKLVIIRENGTEVYRLDCT